MIVSVFVVVGSPRIQLRSTSEWASEQSTIPAVDPKTAAASSALVDLMLDAGALQTDTDRSACHDQKDQKGTK